MSPPTIGSTVRDVTERIGTDHLLSFVARAIADDRELSGHRRLPHYGSCERVTALRLRQLGRPSWCSIGVEALNLDTEAVGRQMVFAEVKGEPLGGDRT